MTDKIEVPTEEQIYQWSLGWREFDPEDHWTTEERILRCAARLIHEALLREAAKPVQSTSGKIEVPEIEYSVLRKFADDKRCSFKDLCDAVREAVESPLRLRAELLREAGGPRKLGTCPICNGNDGDVPCAYTTERPEGCLRVERLRQDAAQSECCTNPAQCWEPCGDLGKSAGHARPHPLSELLADQRPPDDDLRRATDAALRDMYDEAARPDNAITIDEFVAWLEADPEMKVAIDRERLWARGVRNDLEELRRDAETTAAWGRDDLMALAAVRYCIGRMTHIVGDCVDWLIDQWPNFGESIKRTILRDVREAMARDDEDRAEGREHRTLGGDCDRAEWDRFLDFAAEREGGR